MTRVLVVDYGVGNLLSVRRALEHCGAEVELSSDPARVAAGGHLLLPGVGAFGDCMAELRARGLVEPLRQHAASGEPFLGICVGMQMLFDASEEFGEHEGLGLISGRVRQIPGTAEDGTPHKVPHVAWAPLAHGAGAARWDDTILAGLDPGACGYFVHSFAGEPEDESLRIADALYNGRRIAAVVGRDNLVGCQFHPEKSARVGLEILARFVRGGALAPASPAVERA